MRFTGKERSGLRSTLAAPRPGGRPWPAWAGIVVVGALLAYEHSLVKPGDLSKLDAAFFAVNGYISLLFLLFWGAAAAVWRV